MRLASHGSRLEIIGGNILKSKKLFYAALFLILIFFSVLVFHPPILNRAGRFFAPVSHEGAEVVVLEGTQIVKKGALNGGIRLLRDGKAKNMVVVLHLPSKENQVFALEDKYAQLIINELENMGLEKERIQVISAPIDGHPITLAEARFVVNKLSQRGIRKAILLSEGFHTRRSFGVYSQEGKRVGLHVVPYPYFIEYESNEWWHRAEGVSDFVIESFKLAYYIINGYISIKSLW